MRLRRGKRRIVQVIVAVIIMLSILAMAFIQSQNMFMSKRVRQKSLKVEQLRNFKFKDTDVRYVVYNRVPKCASMSMTTLAYHLGAKNGFEVASPFEKGEKPLFSEQEQRDFITFLHNQNTPYLYIRHQYFINFKSFGEKQPLYMNMIRDPIARFESFYFFIRFGNNRGGGMNKNMNEERRYETIDECVKKRRNECISPYWQVVPYFCGNDPACSRRSQWAVDKAKENIEKYYLFVGILEELNDSLNILSSLLPSYFNGAAEFMQSEKNQEMRNGTLTVNKSSTSKATKEFLRTQTSLGLEYDLYDFVLKRFQEYKVMLL